MSSIPNVQFGQTPPTEPGAMPPAPPEWPKVVGIFSIVIGSLGIAAHVCGLLGNIFSQFAMSMMPQNAQVPEQSRAAMAAMSQHTLILAAGSLLSLLAAVVLLIAGVQCVRRRPATRITHLGWIAVRTFAAIVASIGAYLQFNTQMQLMKDSGAAMPPGIGGFMMSFGIVMVFVGFLWAMAYPIFIGVWFLRAKVVAEVNRWRTEGPGLGGI